MSNETPKDDVVFNDYWTPAQEREQKAQIAWQEQHGYTMPVRCCYSCRWGHKDMDGDTLCLHPDVPHIADMPSQLWVQGAAVCDLWRDWFGESERDAPVVVAKEAR